MPIGSPIMNYVKVGDWLLGDIIGEGSDGVVRLALNQHSQIKVRTRHVLSIVKRTMGMYLNLLFRHMH